MHSGGRAPPDSRLDLTINQKLGQSDLVHWVCRSS